uniref:(California timema) hypothetical protein n=1 Tax=Timema californicum TaxID=61474 RepID=A0A7R9JDV1_TIMCA|nr:unnamed protein product [Timema californicum]
MLSSTAEDGEIEVRISVGLDDYSSPMASLVLTDSSQLMALKSYQTKLCIPTPNHMICKNMCLAAVPSNSQNLAANLNAADWFQDCNRTIVLSPEQPRVSVMSPDFPRRYPDNAVCDTRILTLSHYQLIIEFEELLLENEPSCSYDYLELFDGGNGSVATRRLCGDWSTKLKLLRYVSQGPQIRLRFVSDYSHRFSGFKVKVAIANEPTMKIGVGFGVGRRPPDEALKNPGPGKRPAPRRKKLAARFMESAGSGRLVQPILAGGVESFHSRGLKAPSVRKELRLGGKWSVTSLKARALAAVALSMGNKPVVAAEASGAAPTLRVERTAGWSKRESPSGDALASAFWTVPALYKASAAMRMWVSPVGTLQLQEVSMPLMAKKNWRPFSGPTARKPGRLVKAPTSTISGNLTVPMEILTSGSLAVFRRVNAGNTRKLPGGNPNHLGGSSGDESEDNGGLGQGLESHPILGLRAYGGGQAAGGLSASPVRVVGRLSCPPKVLAELGDSVLVIRDGMGVTGQGRGEGTPDT